MNKRWRGRGDVYMLNYDEARQFGRRSGILYHEGNQIEFASAITDASEDQQVLN